MAPATFRDFWRLVPLVVLLLGAQVHAGQGGDDVTPDPTPSSPPAPAGTSSSCVASSIILGGCIFTSSAGIEAHYKLLGTPPTKISFAVRAQTQGWVGISFKPPGSVGMIPADAVIGIASSPPVIQAYQVMAKTPSGIVVDPTVTLENATVTTSGGFTTIAFTRVLAAGRFPIDPTALNYNVAQGALPALSQHNSFGQGVVNLVGGTPTPSGPAAAPATPAAPVATPGPGGCAPSPLLLSGCVIQAGADVEMHYKLLGEPPTEVSIAVRAQTNGWVGVSFKPPGSLLMVPADAVIGFVASSGPSVRAYALNGYAPSLFSASSVTLSNASVTTANGVTTVAFTRALAAGRYPIDPSSVTYNVAHGAVPALVVHDNMAAGTANFLAGSTAISSTDARDKFWVSHGVLMIAAWALFVPHAIGFAWLKKKWSVVFRNDAMWFHVHRFLQLFATAAHIAGMVIALTKFKPFVEDSKLQAHEVIAWIVTALLAIQLFVAIFLRPDKTAPRRPLWNVNHFWNGRVLLLLALVNIPIGIYLYHRKATSSLMPLGAWIGLFLGVLATAVVHYVVMALRPSPPESVDEASQLRLQQYQNNKHLDDIVIGEPNARP